MPALHYISYARFPTEKAHGLQIAQNCEALADNGYEVTLWVSNRKNTVEMNAINDIHGHYGVNNNFEIKRIPSIDLYRFTGGNPHLEFIAFYVHVISYCIMLLLTVPGNQADIYYSRDRYALVALSLMIPKEKLAFEVHQFAPSKSGAWVQKQVAKRVGHIIAITEQLRSDFVEKREAASEKIIVAHDGIREARFSNLPDKITARQEIGWSEDAFIIGFVGQLQMLAGLDKGVGTLIDALAKLEHVTLALVGGPEKAVSVLREKWQNYGLDEAKFLYAGQVKPDKVPHYLSAFDICAMPHPFNPQFAYYTSPLKLFEYMASQRPVVASDLPGWADVIQHEETALLFPPGDIDALSDTIARLIENPDLAKKISIAARERVLKHYTWEARAHLIRNHLEREV